MVLQKFHFATFLKSVLNSYSQIFFVKNLAFAAVMLLVSLANPIVGLSGLAAVAMINGMAYVTAFPTKKIKSGIYGFNAAFLGMAMAYKFTINGSFIAFFVFALILLFMLTVWFETIFAAHQLPMLTLPFVITMMILELAFKAFTNIETVGLFDRYTVVLAQETRLPWYDLAHSLDNFPFPPFLAFFLKTLASVFFSDSILVGIIIAAAILIHSRIQFTVALLGFVGAFFSVKILGADMQVLTQNLGGINYIFWGMAIGSFFIIPNIYSYLMMVSLAPVLFLVYESIERLIGGLGLNSYTLTFSLMSILVLFILKQRSVSKFFVFPLIQYYYPEKTVYKNVNFPQRSGRNLPFKMKLPFLGEWTVSQGYNGEITHLGEWGNALDFVIADDGGKTYSEPGTKKENYFCYNKPVLAPADGYIYQISNITEDNEINNVNTQKNWGNTIVINHLNGLFSQISHLKKDSFKVRTGDYVTKGIVLAMCGNSGRSPEPHLHFQMQLSPEIGSKTHSYPFGYFFEKTAEGSVLHVNETPTENMIVYNVESLGLLYSAFDFKPGKALNVEYNGEKLQWDIATNQFNQSYIHCEKTKSTAYFVNDGTMFYFTDFEGRKKSALYLFYRSCYALLLSGERNIEIPDRIPLLKELPTGIKWLQDFIAPLVLVNQVNYTSKLTKIDNIFYPENIEFVNRVEKKSFGKKTPASEYYVSVTNSNIEINSEKQHLCVGCFSF